MYIFLSFLWVIIYLPIGYLIMRFFAKWLYNQSVKDHNGDKDKVNYNNCEMCAFCWVAFPSFMIYFCILLHLIMK